MIWSPSLMSWFWITHTWLNLHNNISVKNYRYTTVAPWDYNGAGNLPLPSDIVAVVTSEHRAFATCICVCGDAGVHNPTVLPGIWKPSHAIRTGRNTWLWPTVSLVYVFTMLYLLIITLECTLSSSNRKKFAMEQYALLLRQQPHTSHVYLSLDCIIFSCALFNICGFVQ